MLKAVKSLAKSDQEVLSLLSEGLRDHEICQRLKVSLQSLGRSIKRIEASAAMVSDDAGRFYERALRRRAESRCLSIDARFHALMNALPAAVLVINGRTGIISDMNLLAAELFGFEKVGLIGMSVEELVPMEHRDVHQAYRLGFLSSIRKREMGYHPPIYGVRSDGTQIEMAIALTATTADDDVMVVCTEHARWKGANEVAQEAAT